MSTEIRNIVMDFDGFKALNDICSSFWHDISLLCNGKAYRKQQRKATEKPNCYQKVIICPSEPRRRIFGYCGAISALPEAFFFGYSGAIFERSKVSFH